MSTEEFVRKTQAAIANASKKLEMVPGIRNYLLKYTVNPVESAMDPYLISDILKEVTTKILEMMEDGTISVDTPRKYIYPLSMLAGIKLSMEKPEILVKPELVEPHIGEVFRIYYEELSLSYDLEITKMSYVKVRKPIIEPITKTPIFYN